VLYYGDELDLEDATTTGQDLAQRAPMPWSADEHAGFTTGTPWFSPADSYMDGRNVEDQDEDPQSMLNLTRQLVALRQQSDALQVHSMEFLPTRNAAILAFRRTSDLDSVTVVQNFSGWDQTGVTVQGLDGLVELTDQGQAWPGGHGSELDLSPYAYRIFASPSLADHLVMEQIPDPTGR
jgi:glycosidase